MVLKRPYKETWRNGDAEEDDANGKVEGFIDVSGKMFFVDFPPISIDVLERSSTQHVQQQKCSNKRLKQESSMSCSTVEKNDSLMKL